MRWEFLTWIWIYQRWKTNWKLLEVWGKHEMIVISDTTPLISLLKIGKLDLLEGLFHEILIPQAVYEELTSNPRFYDEALQVKNCGFI